MSRPPQPVLEGPVDIEDCHCSCWSRCENSACGLGEPVDRNCACVNGATKVPTLATTASCCAFHMACNPLPPPSAGCRPNEAEPSLCTSGSRLPCERAMVL